MALALAILGGGVAVSRSLDSGPPTRVFANQGDAQPAPGSSTTTATSAPETTSSSSSSTSSSRPSRAVVSTTTTLKATSGPTTTTTAGPTVTTSTLSPGDATTTTSTTNPEPPVCRNSTDSRCGPFRWDPEPTNSPLTVRVSKLTEDAVAGQPVKFKVVVDDLDWKIDSGCYGFEDGYNPGLHCMNSLPACPAEPKAYGPWTPPEKTPDHVEMTPSFTYDEPGTYTVSYTFRTVWSGCQPWIRATPDPYANAGTGSVTFTVRPPAKGEMTTSSR